MQELHLTQEIERKKRQEELERVRRQEQELAEKLEIAENAQKMLDALKDAFVVQKKPGKKNEAKADRLGSSDNENSFLEKGEMDDGFGDDVFSGEPSQNYEEE